jgi:hypothetical protein
MIRVSGELNAFVGLYVVRLLVVRDEHELPLLRSWL